MKTLIALVALAACLLWPARSQAMYVDGMSLYQYVGSNPIDHDDPDGMIATPQILSPPLISPDGEWNLKLIHNVQPIAGYELEGEMKADMLRFAHKSAFEVQFIPPKDSCFCSGNDKIVLNQAILEGKEAKWDFRSAQDHSKYPAGYAGTAGLSTYSYLDAPGINRRDSMSFSFEACAMCASSGFTFACITFTYRSDDNFSKPNVRASLVPGTHRCTKLNQNTWRCHSQEPGTMYYQAMASW